jgi:4-hydroxythreonine-4-phosphate dehydrogenase
MKPLLAVTLGDPCGVGPELAAKAAKDARVRRACRLLFIGPEGPFLSVGPFGPFTPGRPSPESGLASFRAVQLGTRLALERRVDGLVTAPVSKEAWHRAGLPYKGHVDYFRKALRLPEEPIMMFCAGRLRAALATDHVPYRRVPSLLASEAARAARLADRALRELGEAPRLGLCALNPHAGEAGLLGDEEGRVLTPLVRRLAASGLKIEGPISGDGAWQRLAAGEFNALVAMYHDQALGPLRLAAPEKLVQWTLGLPFVRTSPGHGAAFNLAGKNRADPEAMIQALLLAARRAGKA